MATTKKTETNKPVKTVALVDQVSEAAQAGAKEAARDAASALIGHEWAARLLQRAIDAGRVTHAYLFVAPAGSGKARLALDFARALTCRSAAEVVVGDGLRYCGLCRTCRLVAEGHHPDVTFVGLEWQAKQAGGAGSGNVGQNLKIDTVRQISAELSRRPVEAAWKIFVVEDADTLQAEAANAFLKTLEEPPPQAIVILLSDSQRPVLPTILSRCQLLELRPVPPQAITAGLVGRGATGEEADLLARLAVGRPGWAIEAWRTPEMLEERRDALAELEALLPADAAERLALADELGQRYGAGKRETVLATLNTWLGWWRDLAYVAAGRADYVVNDDHRAMLQKQAAALTPEVIRAAILATTRTVDELERNVSPKLALGDLFIHLPKIG